MIDVETIEADSEIVQGLARGDVGRAYSGRLGCGCGCRGKYHDGGSPTATRILRSLQARDGSLDVGRDLDGNVWLAASDERRTWTIYLTSNATRALLEAVSVAQ